MSVEETISRITRFFKREDGSEIRIVAQDYSLPGCKPSLGYYVHRRQSPDQPWQLCGDRPHPDWRSMSVDDYVENGRPEALEVLGQGEILKTLSAIGKPVSFIEGWAS